ncbi:MAG: hypothetical protein SFY92_10970, partial [Verrucomicrobiae bacterium]|nr:hypothetical protein [Verrucomicrobiae bacterium]
MKSPDPSDSPEPAPGFLKRFWPWLVWGVFGFIVLATVGVIGFRFYIRHQIDLEYAKIRAAGYPLTPEDFAKYYPPVPDAENRVLIYRDFNKKMGALPPKYESLPHLGYQSHTNFMNWPKRGDPLPPQLNDLVGELVKDYQPEFESIRRSRSLTNINFNL